MQSPPNMIQGRIEGYAGKLSYEPGEELTLHLSSRGETDVCTVEIARIGRNREVVWSQNEVKVIHQPTPEDAYARGCDWSATLSFTLPAEWAPGYYEVLFRANGDEVLETPAFFVLRSAQSVTSPKILLVLTTNTYSAYNDWGGNNLYTGGVQVSFERPIAPGLLRRPPGELLRAATPHGTYDPELARQRDYIDRHKVSGWSAAAGWFNWEEPFVVWAEENAIELDYAVSSDLELHPEVLDGKNLVLSVGHDEYWSWGMRDTLEQFVAEGGNVAFFSGNSVGWQVRLDADGRTMTSYKYDALTKDPVRDTDDRRFLTGCWSDPVIGRPENLLTGVSFTRGGYARVGYGVPRGTGGYSVWRPDHWVFEGTGLRYGDLVGSENVVVGYEADGCEFVLSEDGLPRPTSKDGTPETFTILATSPARQWSNTPSFTDFPSNAALAEDEPGDLEFFADRLFGSTDSSAARRLGHGNAVLGMYTKGGVVFTTGCTDWAYGLRGHDPLIERITLNVIERLCAPTPADGPQEDQSPMHGNVGKGNT